MRIKPVRKVLMFGFLVWLIPFIISFLIFPIRTSQRPLFESLMPVVVTLCTMLFAVAHFSGQTQGSVKEGVILGAAWLLISIAIDLMMFMEGPMKMSFSDYVMDIGVTYLIIPTVTIGLGFLLQRRRLSPA